MNRGGENREYIGTSLALGGLLGERAYLPTPSPVSIDVATESIQVEALYHGIEEKLHRAFRSRLYPKGTCTITIQFLRIGETVLVALPFEVFSTTSLNMKKRHPHAVLVSCANGYEGYLPPVHGIERGGYEVEPRSMHFVPGTEERIAALIDRRLADF